MAMKTHFSFELYFSAQSTSTPAQRDAVMHTLEPTLRSLLASQDSAATVTVSESHKGEDNKIVEFITTLSDAQIAAILQDFSRQHDLLVAIVE